MSQSYRMTRIYIDSSALTRLMEVAREADLYNNRREARDDNYQAVVELLCDRFKDESAESGL